MIENPKELAKLFDQFLKAQGSIATCGFPGSDYEWYSNARLRLNSAMAGRSFLYKGRMFMPLQCGEIIVGKKPIDLDHAIQDSLPEEFSTP